MSIANRVIVIPEKTEVIINGEKKEVKIDGPKGNFIQEIFSEVEVTREEDKIFTKPKKEDSLHLVGTINSLIYNGIKGCSEGHQKILKVEGVGYKVSLKKEENKGNYLEFILGYSHPIFLPIPSNLEIASSGNQIIIKGIDKQQVGWFAAKIRDYRRPSIYKRNKGIYYIGKMGEAETIKIKAGKTVNK